MVLLTLIRKDLLEQWRTKRVLILMIVLLFVAVSSPIIAKLTPELLKSINVPGMKINLPTPTYVDAVDQFIKNTSQIAMLVVIFIVSGAVSDEKNRKTLEILLTKPVSRMAFVLSKFVSYFVSIAAIFAVGSAIFYLYTISVFSAFNAWYFAIVVGCVLLYTLLIASVTMLASTVVKNSIAAGGVGLISYIFFATVFELFKPLKEYSPNTIFSVYKSVIGKGWNTDLLFPVILSVVLIVVSVMLAVLVFRRQEVER